MKRLSLSLDFSSSVLYELEGFFTNNTFNSTLSSLQDQNILHQKRTGFPLVILSGLKVFFT